MTSMQMRKFPVAERVKELVLCLYKCLKPNEVNNSETFTVFHIEWLFGQCLVSAVLLTYSGLANLGLPLIGIVISLAQSESLLTTIMENVWLLVSELVQSGTKDLVFVRHWTLGIQQNYIWKNQRILYLTRSEQRRNTFWLL